MAARTITISNAAIALYCHENGTGLVLEDRQRGASWRLDCASLVDQLVTFHRHDLIPPIAGCLAPLGAAARDGGIELAFRTDAETVRYFYRLSADAVEIMLPADGLRRLHGISLPGQLVPQSANGTERPIHA